MIYFSFLIILIGFCFGQLTPIFNVTMECNGRFRSSKTELRGKNKGFFVVTWENDPSSYITIFDEDGNNIVRDFKILPDEYEYPKENPKVVALNNGNFIVVYCKRGRFSYTPNKERKLIAETYSFERKGNGEYTIQLQNQFLIGKQNTKKGYSQHFLLRQQPLLDDSFQILYVEDLFAEESNGILYLDVYDQNSRLISNHTKYFGYSYTSLSNADFDVSEEGEMFLVNQEYYKDEYQRNRKFIKGYYFDKDYNYVNFTIPDTWKETSSPKVLFYEENKSFVFWTVEQFRDTIFYANFTGSKKGLERPIQEEKSYDVSKLNNGDFAVVWRDIFNYENKADQFFYHVRGRKLKVSNSTLIPKGKEFIISERFAEENVDESDLDCIPINKKNGFGVFWKANPYETQHIYGRFYGNEN